MRAVLIIPTGLQEGNLIWMPPYIYPEEHLETGIQELKDKGYTIEKIDDQSGLAFASIYTASVMQEDFEVAFRWMSIVFYNDENKIDFKKDILNYATIVLPLARLEINDPIITSEVCIFPAGLFWTPNICLIGGEPLGEVEPKNLRDHITQVTELTGDVFTNMPVVVFNKELWIEDYLNMSQVDDVALIKACSRKSESLMDLLRYYRYDFTSQEFLPAKAGVWNDRYSAMLAFFPVNGKSYFQSREVEVKTFIKGIGMDVPYNDTINISLHPLMYSNTNELQNIAKHALKMYSAISEADDDTMRFTLIMILFDYIGDPNAYGNFKDMKKKFLSCIVQDKKTYDILASRFLELTHGTTDANGNFEIGLRTAIIHTGANIEDIMPNENKRKMLFRELHGYIHSLIHHMIFSRATTWADYDQERIAIKNKLNI